MINIKNHFFKSITILISGSLLAQMVNFITAPIMTRVFSAGDIGVYTYITTIAYLFSPILCGRYESAIILEKGEKNTFALIKGCLIISMLLSIIIMILYSIYFYFNDKIKFYYEYFFVIFLLLLIAGIINVVSAYNNRIKEYLLLSKATVLKSVVFLIAINIFGYLKFGCWGLLLSHLLSQMALLFKQGKSLIREYKVILNININDIKRILKIYSSFPKYSVPASFFNNFSYLSLNFFIGSLYGMDQLGYYSLSFQMLGVPLTLISQNIGTIFFKEASNEYHNSNTFRSTLLRTSILLLCITIPITIFIYYFAPTICQYFLGSKWRISGEYIRILIIMFGIRFIVSPISSGILIAGRNRVEFYGQLCFFVVNICMYFYSYYVYNISIEKFLLIISLSYSFIYCLWFYIIYFFSEKRVT